MWNKLYICVTILWNSKSRFVYVKGNVRRISLSHNIIFHPCKTWTLFIYHAKLDFSILILAWCRYPKKDSIHPIPKWINWSQKRCPSVICAFLESFNYTDAKKIPEKLLYSRPLACFFQNKICQKNFFGLSYVHLKI